MGSKFRAEVDQGLPLGFGQGSAQVGFVRGRDYLHLFQQTGSLICQLQLLASAILRAALTRNQTFCLKFVEQNHQAAG
jgi:hypothetical protein